MVKLLFCLSLLFSCPVVYADTIFLKNGRTIEGVINKDEGDYIELEVCSGSVKFRRDEVEKVERSSEEQCTKIKLDWERQKQRHKETLLQQQKAEESRPRQVEFSQDSNSITLPVTLNRKVEATLVLDTGASIIMLSRNVAEKLGLDVDKLKPDAKVKLADGREVDAKRIVLENVKVQDVDADNVDATILLGDTGGPADGLLGMSFLKRFNFKIDHRQQKLILERL